MDEEWAAPTLRFVRGKKINMSKKKVTDIIAGELSDFLEQEGYELYHLELVKVAKDWFLRVYIDKLQNEYERS